MGDTHRLHKLIRCKVDVENITGNFVVKTLFATVLIMVSAFASATSSHSIRGHVTKKGTYVAPSHATNPNKSTRDNYSHKGNVNPYTGKNGVRSD